MRRRTHTIVLLMTILTAAMPAAMATAQEPTDWSGWYAGAFGGYVNSKLTTNDEAHFETTGDFEDNTPIFGIQIGLNKALENGWVIGGELILPLYMDKGTAVDTEFFPDADPRVIYEADYRWAFLFGGKFGKPVGPALIYGFGALGMANADGKTINLDNQNIYSPGSEQVANATHLVYQLGAGADMMVPGGWILGVRVLAFNSNLQQYEMPWNEGELNEFGMNALLMQVQWSYQF